MMHFAAREAPFPYARQLRRLFKKYGADTSGLYRIAIEDFWELEVKWRSKGFVKTSDRLGCVIESKIRT